MLSKFQKQSPQAKLEYEYPLFIGLNNADDPSSIHKDYSPDTLNTVLDVQGAIKNRKGYTRLLTTTLASPTGGGFGYYKSDGTTKQLLFASGISLYRYDNAGGVVNIGGTYTTGLQWDFDEYGDLVYAGNGTDSIQQYNGTSTTALSGITPVAQFLRVHKNRLWYAAKNTSRLYFSNAGDPTTIPANNYFDVNTSDGQVITAIEVLLDSLIVFKTDSIWIITGEPLGAGTNTTIGNLNLRRANSDVGCVAFRTVKKVGPVLLFMSRYGLHVFENYQSKRISDDVDATFRSGMNPNFQSASWAVNAMVEKKYILGYADTSSTTPNRALVYDLTTNKFTMWDHLPGAWGINFRFNQLDSVVMGDPVKGNLYQLFQGFADIAGYNGNVTSATSTSLTDSAASWTTNQFVDARVEVGMGTSSYSFAVVSSNTATVLTTSAWSNGTPSVNQAYTIGGYNSYWRAKTEDFGSPEMSKRYKYWNIFTDSESNYTLKVGAALDFAATSYNLPELSLSSGSTLWDQAGVTWDEVGIYWDSKASLFKRSYLPGTGRYLDLIFGNYNANQPWRVFSHSVSYKLKKGRPT